MVQYPQIKAPRGAEPRETGDIVMSETGSAERGGGKILWVHALYLTVFMLLSLFYVFVNFGEALSGVLGVFQFLFSLLVLLCYCIARRVTRRRWLPAFVYALYAAAQGIALYFYGILGYYHFFSDPFSSFSAEGQYHYPAIIIPIAIILHYLMILWSAAMFVFRLRDQHAAASPEEPAPAAGPPEAPRWDKSKSLILSRVMVYVFFAALVAAVITLPWMLEWYFDRMQKDRALLTPLMIGLWISAVWAFGALFCLDRLLWNMARSLVFIPENVRYLRALSWCCFAVSALLIAFCASYLPGAALAVLAAFAGLIVRVVKNAFNKAVDLQRESDLTV